MTIYSEKGNSKIDTTMDREIVIRYIKDNMNSEIHPDLIEAILKFIPQLGHYYEEDKKINFGIILAPKSVDMCQIGYPMLKYQINKPDGENTNQIIKMIKNVAILCGNSGDIYIVQDDSSSITCGVVFENDINPQLKIDKLLKDNCILFRHKYENKVYVITQEKLMTVAMDFDKVDDFNDNYVRIDGETDYIIRFWNQLFQKVQRSVHGTICLIVDVDWKIHEDDNFVDGYCIPGKELLLTLKEDSGLSDYEYQCTVVNMFLAMLEYDGITIIDTSGKIRAYHVFCKVKNKELGNVSGGARHKAYETLKNEGGKNYKAVYFQSQEGEVKFYEFGSKEKEKNYFDATIMSFTTKNNRFEKKVSFYKNKERQVPLTSNVNQQYIYTERYVKELLEAHQGVDNFYNEPGKAKQLLDYIKSNSQAVMTSLEEEFELRSALINTVFKCKIGHVVGYSYNAQEYLDEIIECIDSNVWKQYIENYEYLDCSFLWYLVDVKENTRWQETLRIISEKINVNIASETVLSGINIKEYKELYELLTSD